ncbi:bifunctional tRNA (5-methylaminomethyl-2-thiouridine)(34)-methyltransferase MnmD/FAD-dependent 5-carboxymethylaminomethyl-2-thiouridine(34) oxidoreductase MnmC [Ferrimonas aestuarii]|uniref:tRNA 5-methylaminomethyl-2-thiouridine biosynthesis bifunctional protein MnmC n=1 Tax=Ferrimonas aestuarii TaxID=2569539 RepID=A0A4U1BP00_9GAMM|nr:bifunctional tRNA (5-methylaminomethyl-2-thiouridine)(34)-methyltransferase MnmD/FAD-dependent 5-carboxymethylaminomethyl-2-thiouridine(34) oxidoreductase MnmC [Ferrimonas aestuarii]TKB53920.1 bifunctional tRNA (5-methylaminomethyl-2-thiouridine)(34)-methyltransferase MnmD/FAD-dependent 5-carboxymethylaminomethyl-2-thiouridine(34) oxidoreductase MnmC [Ferrimonas aestuarii]
MKPIAPAQIDWRDSDTPMAPEFDDVYFSTDDGADETRYVFMQHNDLPNRFVEHKRATLVVAETGFGTGLNLCVLWQAFREFRHSHPNAPLKRLHFVTLEKHPVTPTDLAKAHRFWPQYGELTSQIQTAYPMPIEGCHRMEMDDGEVIVDLWLGDVQTTLPQIHATEQGLVDIWFLDGFTPSRNPDMWQGDLYAQMARLSRANATYATFTAAGHVRRGLEEAGFSVNKDVGYGVKREMIYGRFLTPREASSSELDGDVAIIGAGIAGAQLALSLCQRGIKVSLFSEDIAPADGASGNRQGAIYPLMNLAEDGLSQFYQQSYLLSRARINRLAKHHPFDFDWCGVLQLSQNAKDADKLARIANSPFPTELVHQVTKEQASHIADLPLNRGGLYFPYGGWVSPKQTVASLLAQAQDTGNLSCHYQYQLTQLEQLDSGHWQLHLSFNDIEGVSEHAVAEGIEPEFANVVICQGHRSSQLPQTAPLPLSPVRGQVSIPKATTTTAKLKTVLCADGYLVPALKGRLVSGASFVKGSVDVQWREQDREEIQGRMQNSFGGCLDANNDAWIDELDWDETGRAAIRGAVRDHFPLVGPIPDWSQIEASPDSYRKQPLPTQQGLYLIAGLGSRGLCSAPLLAEITASMMNDEPLPVSEFQLKRLLPGRFWQRRLDKGKSPTE